MLEKTNGIVLKTLKYGDTSVIASIFTERLGLQSYMIKGVRSANRRNNKAALLFPSAILDLVVYHNPQKELQFTREIQLHHYYENIGDSVIRTSVAIFAMELLLQLIITGDIQEELFLFTKDFLIQLDAMPEDELGNLPLYFLIQCARRSGYHLSGYFSDATPILDLAEGRYREEAAYTDPVISRENAAIMDHFNHAFQIEGVKDIKLKKEQRAEILGHYLHFLKRHVPQFKELKSVGILAAILH